jgi:hypothetical protein
MKTKYRIKSWNKMFKEFGVNSRGHINCKSLFTENMNPLCGMTVEKDCEELDGYTISPDMIEEYTEYEVGDAIKVQNGKFPIVIDRYYAGMVGDKVLATEYKQGAQCLYDSDWVYCALYDRIVEEPKEEYLDLSKEEIRVFNDRVGELFFTKYSFSKDDVKRWHNDGMRLLVSIDPETNKAVTKSLKVGEE